MSPVIARPLEKSDSDAATAFRDLLAYLALLDIKAPVVPYPVHRTVEEGKLLRGAMAGTFTKNLLLRDRKRRLFLVSVHEDRTLDLKTLHTHIGARGQLSFAPVEDMMTILGVAPGTMTPLALMNDRERRITCVLDATLLEATQINFHPLVQTRSIGLQPDQLLAFLTSCGHPPVLLVPGERWEASGDA